MADSYPVKWMGKEYALGNLTVKVKDGFCKWVKQWLTAEGMENIGQWPDRLNSYLASVYANVWWGDGGQSKLVNDALRSEAGGLALNRLLFGDSVKILSDADLLEMIVAKEADPLSDYAVALAAIRETADPKAPTGPATGAGPAAATSTTAPS